VQPVSLQLSARLNDGSRCGTQLNEVNSQFNNRCGTNREAGSLGTRHVSESIAGANGTREFLMTRARWYVFVALILLTLIVFWSPLQELLAFASNSEFSYIPVVPVISAFLVMTRRRQVLADSKPCLALGALITALGILLLSLAKIISARTSADRLLLPALGIVTTCWGLFIVMYGIRAARKALLPLGLLLFMVPAPQRVIGEVIALLQHGSAILAYSGFRMIGVPAIREGMTISLPRLTIEVAPECSGIRSSLSLLIITLAGANLYLHSTWNKLLLASLLVPLSILKNAIRIVILSTLAIYVDPRFLTGPVHHRGGILFFFYHIYDANPDSNSDASGRKKTIRSIDTAIGTDGARCQFFGS
jgi:exosortase